MRPRTASASEYLIPMLPAALPRRVAVVGAGGGLDVEAALLHGAEHVDAVEIDPAIIRLARRYSAAGVYGKPEGHAAHGRRAGVLRAGDPGYDLVIFGLLDSHGLFSSMANIRLDGFVYTVEGLRSAWTLLNDRGVLSLAFVTTSRPWLGGKLYRMVTEATGPTAAGLLARRRGMVLIVEKQPMRGPAARLSGVCPVEPVRRRLASPPATDDWPYLYLRERTDSVGLPACHPEPAADLGAGGGSREAARERVEDLHFGGDGHWVSPARDQVHRRRVALLRDDLDRVPHRDRRRAAHGACWRMRSPAAPRVLSLALRSAHRLHSAAVRGSAGDSFLGCHSRAGRVDRAGDPDPDFFAGLVFSGTFKRAQNPSAAFGANLVGAMLGGFAEYLEHGERKAKPARRGRRRLSREPAHSFRWTAGRTCLPKA